MIIHNIGFYKQIAKLSLNYHILNIVLSSVIYQEVLPGAGVSPFEVGTPVLKLPQTYYPKK